MPVGSWEDTEWPQPVGGEQEEGAALASWGRGRWMSSTEGSLAPLEIHTIHDFEGKEEKQVHCGEYY